MADLSGSGGAESWVRARPSAPCLGSGEGGGRRDEKEEKEPPPRKKRKVEPARQPGAHSSSQVPERDAAGTVSWVIYFLRTSTPPAPMPLLESGENSREPARRDVGAGPGSGKGAPEMENVRV